ncbi:MAG: glycosyltransferase [Cyclobacteriaceae bacterium]
MKIILISVGTRGDVEPFLALAEYLREANHEVIAAFPEQFADLAADANIPFFGLTRKFLELIDSEDGKMLMGGKGSLWTKARTLFRMYKVGMRVNKVLVDEQQFLVEREKPELILYNGKSTFPIIWSVLNPGRAIMVSPVPCLIHPVNEYPHIGITLRMGTILNRFSYRLGNLGLFKSILNPTKDIRKEWGISNKKIREAVFQNKMVFTVSPSLFPRPDYWPDHVRVMGYHERNKKSSWKPDDALLGFLEKYPKVIFITFGSMTNPDPVGKSAVIISVLKKHQIPAIINTAAGGLIKPKGEHSDLLHFVSQIPYDWIFPKVHAVIHHGGSGTTHTALKYGCASMIISHIIDQHFWSRLIGDIGVGPEGIRLTKLTRDRLEPKLLDLFTNPIYKTNAVNIGQQMAVENYKSQLVDFVTS